MKKILAAVFALFTAAIMFTGCADPVYEKPLDGTWFIVVEHEADAENGIPAYKIEETKLVINKARFRLFAHADGYDAKLINALKNGKDIPAVEWSKEEHTDGRIRYEGNHIIFKYVYIQEYDAEKDEWVKIKEREEGVNEWGYAGLVNDEETVITLDSDWGIKNGETFEKKCTDGKKIIYIRKE